MFNYFVANLLGSLSSKFYQNPTRFAEVITHTKTFWLTFYQGIMLEFSRNATFEFYKVV